MRCGKDDRQRKKVFGPGMGEGSYAKDTKRCKLNRVVQ